jgi:hypothetical protein
MSKTADLSVRQHARQGCDVPAGVTVAGPSIQAVKLVKIGGSGAAARVVDFSLGGLGLSSPVYFPLTSQLRVTLADAGGQTLKVDLRVQRSAMTDRTPTYYIGTSFDTSTPEQQQAVAKVLAFLKTLPAMEAARA